VSVQALHILTAFIGVASQLGGAVLLVALFVLLRGYARRRAYFRAWTIAWIALAAALIVVVLRYVALVDVGVRPEDELRLDVRLLYFAYQLGKLLFFGALLAGTLAYTAGRKPAEVLRPWLVGAGAYTAISTGLSPGLSEILAWQAPVALGVAAVSATRLLRLPPRLRSLGSRVAGGCFAALAVAWTLYLLSLWHVLGWGQPLSRTLETLTRVNSFVDLLLQMLLGFGMVLMLMEDAKREADDARAELAVANDELRRASLVDPLTGAWNRRAFADEVGWEGVRARHGAVVVLDLDDLKVVNDRHGHPAGDGLLRHAADVLRAATRPTDRLYRWGGDEFVLLLPGGHAAEAGPRFETLLASAPPAAFDGGVTLPLRMSVGAADYPAGGDCGAAVARADAAMYRRKQQRKSVAS
jgi:diguanylate cyclase (GGDEF)-like protein